MFEKVYKNKHNWVEKVTLWESCKCLRFDHANNQYIHLSESVQENEIRNSPRFFEITKSMPEDHAWLVAWLFGFYVVSIFVGYLMPNASYTNYQFYFKQFSLAWIQLSKIFVLQVIQFSQKVLIQTIHFIINIVFVHTYSNVKKSAISSN